MRASWLCNNDEVRKGEERDLIKIELKENSGSSLTADRVFHLNTVFIDVWMSLGAKMLCEQQLLDHDKTVMLQESQFTHNYKSYTK